MSSTPLEKGQNFEELYNSLKSEYDQALIENDEICKEYESTIELLKDTLKKTNIEKEKLQIKNKEKLDDIQDLTKLNDKLNEDIKKAKEEKKLKESKIVFLENDNEHYQSKIRQFEAIVDDLNAQLESTLEESYISDPIVTAKFKNFQITVIGMAGTGNYTIEKDRLNLIEALAMIGNIPNNALIDDVMVIRTQDGFRTAYSVNLQTKDLFDSPVYYLQQNDVIYIKPSKYVSDGRFERVWSVTSSAFSFISVISNFFLWRYLFKNGN